MKNLQEHFVRNEGDKSRQQALPFGQALKCALSGFFYVCHTQRNIKIHAVFTLVALLLGIVLAIPPTSWLAVIICIGVVFTAECFNTALESVVDLVSPEYHLLAKRAKDSAAAAVLCSAIVSLVVGFVVFGIPFITWILPA